MALVVTNVLTLTSTAFNAALSGAMSTALGVRTVADVMSQRLAAKDTAIKRAQATKTKRKVATKKFGAQLTARTKRVAARSIAAIPAEAIPYLGIAAVLAATSYELYEACQSMKDLAELYASLEVQGDPSDDTMQAVCNPQLPNSNDIWTSVKTKADTWIDEVLAQY